MNIRKFRIFYEVANELNMTKVANKLYISQPAISQTIHEIEQELGVVFFDRIGKKLFLTYEGEIFLNYVRRILNLYDESIDVVKDIKKMEKGVLRIGASTTIGIYVLPELIKKFWTKYKNVDISIIIENTENIANMILENKIDFAFVEGPVHSNEISVEQFWQDELVFIAPANHRWKGSKIIDDNEMIDEKIIIREKGSGTREIFETNMASRNIRYTIAFELGNTEAIKKSVEAGMGISCISVRCIKDELRTERLLSVRLKDMDIKREFNLIYHKDKYLSNLITEFLKFAKTFQ